MVPTEYSKGFRHVRSYIYIEHAILTICDLIGQAILTMDRKPVNFSTLKDKTRQVPNKHANGVKQVRSYM